MARRSLFVSVCIAWFSAFALIAPASAALLCNPLRLTYNDNPRNAPMRRSAVAKFQFFCIRVPCTITLRANAWNTLVFRVPSLFRIKDCTSRNIRSGEVS
jgi:hypothetical protein